MLRSASPVLLLLLLPSASSCRASGETEHVVDAVPVESRADAVPEAPPHSPVDEPTPLRRAYDLNVESIIELVHQNSPRVTASREEMVAAEHGLEEFRTNLSRLEPFLEVSSDVSDFPNRRGAFGSTAEAVVGLEKETFEGALLRAEFGGAYSRFEFNDEIPPSDVEEGAGGLVRARVEAPFFGSRRRQNRVIAQAYQESTARKAQLDYLRSYREYVTDALTYYSLVVYYRELAEAYHGYAEGLRALLGDDRLRPEDRGRVESVLIGVESTRDQYRASEREYLTTLLAEIGIAPDAEYTIDRPRRRLSAFAVQARDPDGLADLLEKARNNNPTFRVLNDAIEDAELQRAQAIAGEYDVSTFLEGSLFPVGSTDFDDRLDGWLVAAGVTLRLNDARVLTATRLKAEAQIRQFRAEIQAEEVRMRRRIETETRGLLDNDANLQKLDDVRERRKRVFEQRVVEYFDGKVNIDQVLDARSSLASTDSNIASNLYNSRNRESRVMGATGVIYEMVGLHFAPSDDE